MISPGRPCLTTIERIVRAGERIALPRLLTRGVTKEPGVSETSIHRIVGNPEGLKAMVTEGIIAGCVFPGPTATDPEDALTELTHTLRDFVMANPDIGQHLARLAAPGHEFTIRLAEGQQATFTSRLSYPPTQVSLLVSTAVEYAIVLDGINPLFHDDTAPGLLPKQAPMVRIGVESTALLSPQERFG